MHITLNFIRVIFFLLSIFFMTVYMVGRSEGSTISNLLMGAGYGLGFGFILLLFSFYFRKFNLRSFNVLVIGIFFGYFLGLALNLIFQGIIDISHSSITGEVFEQFDQRLIEMVKICLYLFGIFLGTLLTLRAADELYVSIPFIKFSPVAQKKKDILLDLSALHDIRILDLANSGLLDSHLIIPRFIVKELYSTSEAPDETKRLEARKCLEVVKKLELNQELDIRFNDTDFPEAKDISNKMLRLARLLDANILSSELTKTQTGAHEEVKVINLHYLSNALKPLTSSGEVLHIKVQRYGKEPRQGIGYLEDGTMVVINGGGAYIGQTIEANVLSVKHTSSGRMIFCNLVNDKEDHEQQ